MYLKMKGWKPSDIKTGVYSIRNTVNGKRYIGSGASDFLGRCRGHRLDLRTGKHKNRHLQSSWSKYGEKVFVFEVVELCVPKKCLRREQHWMDFYKSRDSRFGYNKAKAEGGMLGYKMTPEQRKRNGDARRGKKRPLYAVLASAEGRRGHKHSEATKAHWSKIRKGRPRPVEASIKAANSNRGKKRSPEFCKRMSEIMTGNQNGCGRSEEALARNRVKGGNFKGHKHSEKSKKLIGEKGLGRKHTEDAKRRIGEGVRAFRSQRG